LVNLDYFYSAIRIYVRKRNLKLNRKMAMEKQNLVSASPILAPIPGHKYCDDYQKGDMLLIDESVGILGKQGDYYICEENVSGTNKEIKSVTVETPAQRCVESFGIELLHELTTNISWLERKGLVNLINVKAHVRLRKNGKPYTVKATTRYCAV
jgi:hypothetical protein